MNNGIVNCHQLGEFSPDNLEAVRQGFAPAYPLDFQQGWLGKTEPDFAPGTVRIGWRRDVLLVFAELTDADIFTRATSDNERFWELGDTFEIFLRPEGQAVYVEFHVAPNNLHLKLRFKGPEDLEQVRQSGRIESVLVHGPAFTSTVWIQPESQRWHVFAEIPVSSVVENIRLWPGSKWHFSFGRYDYSGSRTAPVISSTSPHAEPNFHRQADWRTLQISN